MSIGGMFIGLMLLVMTIPFILNPFLQKKTPRVSALARKLNKVPDLYADALAALRDLDFDHRIGKLTDQDYETLRADLLARAAQELEMKKQQELELDASLESKIQARKKEKLANRSCKQCGIRLTATDVFCSACGATSKQVCQNCGHEIESRDLFCVGCGQPTRSVQTPRPEAV